MASGRGAPGESCVWRWMPDQITPEIASVTADGAYDGTPTYEAVAAHGATIQVIIPPHVTAIPSDDAAHNPSQRDQHIASIAVRGRLGWQKETGYGRRALAETAMGRYRAIIGPCLRARRWPGQRAEAAVAVAVLNRMLDAGRPDSVRSRNRRSVSHLGKEKLRSTLEPCNNAPPGGVTAPPIFPVKNGGESLRGIPTYT